MESSIDVWHWVGLVAGSAKADDYDCQGWKTLNLRTFEETFIIMRINFYFNISPNEFLLFSENHLKNKNKFWYIFLSPFANDKVLCFNIFFICYFFPSSSSSSFLTWLHTHTVLNIYPFSDFSFLLCVRSHPALSWKQMKMEMFGNKGKVK